MNLRMIAAYPPSIAVHPELNKEYFLHYYFQKGDPYEVRATICFLASLKDAPTVKRLGKDGIRRFKATDD